MFLMDSTLSSQRKYDLRFSLFLPRTGSSDISIVCFLDVSLTDCRGPTFEIINKQFYLFKP